MAKRHDLCVPKNCTPPFTRWRTDFSFNLHLTKTRPILAISQKSLIFASFTRKRQFLRCHGKTDILQFPTDASLARPPSFPTGQLTFGRLAAGDCGHNLGNALFSSSVRIVFTAWRFLSPAAHGQTYGIILSPPFSIRLSPSQNHGLCVCGQNTRISTVPTCGIGLPFRSVWLFDTLFKRSKTHGRIFDFPSLKNRFATKKAVFFSLSAAFAVCFLLTDFLGFYYLQTFAVWLTFESLYIFCFCFPRLFCRGVSLSGSIQL